MRLECEEETHKLRFSSQLLLPLRVDGVSFKSKWPRNQFSKFGVLPPLWGFPAALTDLRGHPSQGGEVGHLLDERRLPGTGGVPGDWQNPLDDPERLQYICYPSAFVTVAFLQLSMKTVSLQSKM